MIKNERRGNDNKEIEPRVAKLETSIDMLTNDVRDLVSVVRDQGKQTETQIQNLLVAVTTAAAPKRTDWQALIALCALLLALGAAAYAPLSLRVEELYQSVERSSGAYLQHISLPLHPVGQARIDALENQDRRSEIVLKEQIQGLNTKLQEQDVLISNSLKESIAEANTRFQREFDIIENNTRSTISTLQMSTKEATDLLNSRLKLIEQELKGADKEIIRNQPK